MDDQNTTIDAVADVLELATWERPELRRLEAADAETAGGAGADGGVFS